MLTFSRSKINIGLNITGKTPDGYHTLESIFIPISWGDALEIIDSSCDSVSFEFRGLPVPGISEKNNLQIVLKKIKEVSGISAPPHHVIVFKNVPSGAGLGGGSGDAAAYLEMLNSKYRLGFDEEIKFKILAQTGSDCPFFQYNSPCFISGTGTIIHPLPWPSSLKEKFLVCIWPSIFSSTAEAYRNCIPKKPDADLKELVLLPVQEWKHYIKNDFEAIIFKKYPQAERLKELLYDKGALYASLSGSGSAVYGIFENEISSDLLNLPNDYLYYSEKFRFPSNEAR